MFLRGMFSPKVCPHNFIKLLLASLLVSVSDLYCELFLALAVGHDNFVGLPDGTLSWTARRLRILHEILLYDPDVICLQVRIYNYILK